MVITDERNVIMGLNEFLKKSGYKKDDLTYFDGNNVILKTLHRKIKSNIPQACEYYAKRYLIKYDNINYILDIFISNRWEYGQTYDMDITNISDYGIIYNFYCRTIDRPVKVIDDLKSGNDDLIYFLINNKVLNGDCFTRLKPNKKKGDFNTTSEDWKLFFEFLEEEKKDVININKDLDNVERRKK